MSNILEATENNIFRAFDILVKSSNYEELLGFQTVPRRCIIFKGGEITEEQLVAMLEKSEI